MKKLVVMCCVAAILAACKSTTNTINASIPKTETTTTTTTTTKPEEAKPEEAAEHNYSIVSGIGSHYIVNDTIYNEIAIEIDGMPEYFSVSENVISNADYIVVLDHDKIITFSEY